MPCTPLPASALPQWMVSGVRSHARMRRQEDRGSSSKGRGWRRLGRQGEQQPCEPLPPLPMPQAGQDLCVGCAEGGVTGFREWLWPQVVLSHFLTAPQAPSPMCQGVLPALPESRKAGQGGYRDPKGAPKSQFTGVFRRAWHQAPRSWTMVCLTTILHRFTEKIRHPSLGNAGGSSMTRPADAGWAVKLFLPLGFWFYRSVKAEK